ncbi:hypothetical protein [Peribacillus simplex]|uniref:hypothetical protein n=1 Tax=Peribacillus simplex TaxID=1478 RepID=UPI003D2A19B0
MNKPVCLFQLNKLSMQTMLTFSAMNVKKMTNWTWQDPRMEQNSMDISKGVQQ